MKKILGLIAIIITVGISFYIWNTTKVITISDSFIDEIFIGEAFKSGDIYIEPFGKERGSFDNIIEKEKIPSNIEFYSIDKNEELLGSNPIISNIYIPNREEDSMYFLQAFSEPKQPCLKYKSEKVIDEVITGVVILNHKGAKVDYSNKGLKRNYSEEEYKLSQKEVLEDNAIDESLRTLEPINLENTIVGAVQVCSIELKDIKIKMAISKYETHGTEYAGTVYVIDLIGNNKIIRTIKKYNADGPY